jgi:hypothetical protein
MKQIVEARSFYRSNGGVSATLGVLKATAFAGLWI